MSPLDIINGAFESGGALAAIQNCRRLARDRKVSGVDWRVTAFFMAWGVWNMAYYPALGQWASTAGGAILAAANAAWVVMALRWRRAGP